MRDYIDECMNCHRCGERVYASAATSYWCRPVGEVIDEAQKKVAQAAKLLAEETRKMEVVLKRMEELAKGVEHKHEKP